MTDHLKPYQFKPGTVNNPSGRPKLTSEEIFMRENFQKSFAMLGNKTIEEIKILASDPKQPAPIAIAAKALEWAFKKGNPAMYREIWDRTMGKVTQQVEVKSINPYEEMPLEELKELVRKQLESESVGPSLSNPSQKTE